jgi:hypothetical protein
MWNMDGYHQQKKIKKMMMTVDNGPDEDPDNERLDCQL